MTRHARPVDLPLELAASTAPLRHRIADAVIEVLRVGTLRPGDELPATRALAADLGVSRTAVLAAYDELAAAGFVHAVAGSSTIVSEGADLAARAGVGSHIAQQREVTEGAQDSAQQTRWYLMPGYPDTGLIDTGAWRSAWRAAAHHPVDNGLLPDQPLRPLREGLAVHMRRTRGVVTDPADIILVPGVSSGLRALVRTAGLAGRRVGVEEPGYPEGRRAIAAAGGVVTPIPVDENGLDPATLTDEAAVYTTPAHQYPLGGRLSASRRAALIRWARSSGALVIEDDYDGEFRYDVRGLPALHGLTDGPDVVAYVGTASKILTPGLRIAWMVAPAWLREPVREALLVSDEWVGVPSGQALAEFIGSGNLTRHLARTARTYAARRHSLITALHERAPALRITGVDAGLHLVAWLPPGTDERGLQLSLCEAGLAVDVLGEYCATPSMRQALVCGYALLPETAAKEAAAVIASQLRTT